MKHLHWLFLFVIMACSTQTSNNTQLKRVGNHIIDLAKNRQDPQTIAMKAEEFLSLARPMVSQAKDSYPTCAPLFDAILKDEAKMKSLALSDIETLYHEGEALPETDDLSCYNVKELIVHPATVVVLAKQRPFTEEHYAQMVDEMVEVIEHMSDI